MKRIQWRVVKKVEEGRKSRVTAEGMKLLPARLDDCLTKEKEDV